MTDSLDRTPSADPSLVVVGRVLGAHGVGGDLRLRTLSDVPDRFDPGRQLYLQGTPYPIEACTHASADVVIIKLAGIGSSDAAGSFTGAEVMATAEESPNLPEGEFFHYQLMGMRVLAEDGEDLGQIIEIIITGSNDVYVVSGPKGEILIPALAQVILNVDTAGMEMRVRLMDGLR